ncbi:hypothetical protein LJB42_000195 [Komagataella kurtzmanii]|nr:hypothetical protein LJB42_000195 [Komagataella kurtzmanii]
MAKEKVKGTVTEVDKVKDITKIKEEDKVKGEIKEKALEETLPKEHPLLTLPTTKISKLVIGYLKGYDQLMNLVLDDAEEILKSTEKRTLGRVIVRGPKLVSLALADGSEEVANPFTQNEEAEENRV